MHNEANKIKTKMGKFEVNSVSVSACITLFHYHFAACKFGGGWDDKIGVKGVTPSKTHGFWPICLLPLDNFATFLAFSLFFLLFFFLLGFCCFDVPLTENFKGGGHLLPHVPLCSDVTSEHNACSVFAWQASFYVTHACSCGSMPVQLAGRNGHRHGKSVALRYATTLC